MDRREQHGEKPETNFDEQTLSQELAVYRANQIASTEVLLAKKPEDGPLHRRLEKLKSMPELDLFGE